MSEIKTLPMLSSQLLFFFSALGAFNGLLLTIYLLIAKPVSLERRLLAGLLFVISIRISKSIWFYFDPNVGKQFLQVGLSACLLIGPLLFEYINATLMHERDKSYWKWHLSAWLLIVVSVGILYPYPLYPDLWGEVFYRLINWVWAAYIVLAALRWYSVNHFAQKDVSNDPWQRLCTHVLLGTSLIWVAYFTASYTSYIVGALSFSFTLYVTVLLWFFNRREKLHVKYADRSIDVRAQDHMSTKLTTLMREQQLYKNANLTLPELAKRIQVSVPVLSQFLNDNLEQSFSTYVNQWRIEEAKRLLLEQPNLTMDLIAEACGYNSQSTFYSAFKQFENSTPAKYRKAHIPSS